MDAKNSHRKTWIFVPKLHRGVRQRHRSAHQNPFNADALHAKGDCEIRACSHNNQDCYDACRSTHVDLLKFGLKKTVRNDWQENFNVNFKLQAKVGIEPNSNI